MQTTNKSSWIKILNKGVVTLPKLFREKLGLKDGEIAKIRVEGRKIIIEPRDDYDYRIFSDEEINQWKKEDQLDISP
jgi:AbrB family looped-hinge helix DNA binding protein